MSPAESAVTCEKCGEPLLGPVNRCWRCGTDFSRVTQGNQPPVRRSPVLSAYLHSSETTDAEIVHATLESSAEPAAQTVGLANLLVQLAVSAWVGLVVVIGAACLVAATPWAILPAIASTMFTIWLIRQGRSPVHWAAFGIGVVTLNIAFVRLIESLLRQFVGTSLYWVFYGP